VAALDQSSLSPARGGLVSHAAIDLLRASEVVDLHIDSFVPARLFGYALDRRHGPAPLYGRFFGHLDFPRAIEAHLTGAMWSITTNPFRTARGRWRTFLENLADLRARIEATGGRFAIAKNARELRAARARGAHACLLAIQGGSALTAAPEGPRSIPDDVITRVTIVHLTSSAYGITSSPLSMLAGERGLGREGHELVERLDSARILVDLAHIHPKGFWDAAKTHDRTLPLIATHTGVSGVTPHWRNIDDDQIRAIADTGGTIGIIFAKNFLGRRGGPRDGRMVVEHMKHVIEVAGDDFVSIGSDFDGAIVPPPDLRREDAYQVLVQHLLDAGLREETIQKILGANAIRVLEAIRP
jgi:membrane dipeptidase